MARILDSIQGHSKVVQQLMDACKNDRLPPTLLLVGPSGLGKKQVALGLAQALICDQSPIGCGQCGPCRRVENGQSESLMIVEPSAGGQIKIDQARAALKFLTLQQVGQARVVVIDSAHLLNPQAANSLLKSLEEPPERTWFLLVASGLSGVLPTIRSRAQILRFAPLSREELKKATQAPDWVVESAQGRLDVVDELLDEDIGQARIKAFSVWDFWLKGQRQEAMEGTRELVREREKALFVVRCWQQLLRDAWYDSEGLPHRIHADFKTLSHELGQLGPAVLDTLARQSLQLEHDIVGNVDRSLSFDDYFYTAERVIGRV